MITSWIKIFYTQFKNNILYSLLNIAGLSIGIAGLIFAILYWNNENSYDQWNKYKNEVYQVFNVMNADEIWSSNPAPLGPYAAGIEEVDNICYFHSWYDQDYIYKDGKKTMMRNIVRSDSNFLKQYPFPVVMGSADGALSGRFSMILSEETAKELFGAENPIGKSVKFQDSAYTVKAVYQLVKPSSIQPSLVVSGIIRDSDPNNQEWGNFNYGLSIRLKKDVDPAVVEKKLYNVFYEHRVKKSAKEEGISPEEFVNKYGAIKPMLKPLPDLRLRAKVPSGMPEGKGNYVMLLIMVGLSLLILVLSIVNFVNLATANAIKRAKEVGIRKTIGATRTQIITQFIFESAMLCLVSIILALTFVELALPVYNTFLNKQLTLDGEQFYTQLIVIFAAVVLMAGFFPALYVANFDPVKVLKGNFSRSKGGIWLRNGMLVLQYAISAFFIIGGIVVYQQVRYMASRELGFSGAQVLEVNFMHPDEQLFDKYLTIKQEVMKIPGVVEISASGPSPGGGSRSSSNLDYKDQSIQGQNYPIDYNYFDMMKIQMVSGRKFDPKIASDTVNAIIINETAAKMLGLKDPLNAKLKPGYTSKELTVIGVAKDFHLFGFQEKIPPMSFVHFKTVGWMAANLHMAVKISPQNMDQTIAALEKFWTTNVDTEYPFSYSFIDKNFERTYADYVKQKNLFFILNAIVILISMFGLFALAAYSMERRVKETAIRKTLGASTGSLVKTLSLHFVLLGLLGFVIALIPSYFLMQKWLNTFAFRIDMGWLPFAVCLVVLLALTISVVSVKAFFSTRINILKYLKYE